MSEAFSSSPRSATRRHLQPSRAPYREGRTLDVRHHGTMSDDEQGATLALGQTGLRVPRLGLGVMVWGDMSGARWSPARNVYGPMSSKDEQREALELSLAAGVNLLDTAAMYGNGASERRVGELTEGRDLLVATKFPARFLSRAGSLPTVLEA